VQCWKYAEKSCASQWVVPAAVTITMNEDKTLLDVDTIKAAVAGEAWAVEKVVIHYSDEIDKLATVTKKMPDGSKKQILDEDMRQAMITKLIEELPNFKDE